MKEKLIIKNFGPIKEVDLDLGKVTVLIGEQATGKSTIAKVLAVCRYFSYIVGNKGLLWQHNDKFYSTVTVDIPFIDGLAEWGLSEAHKNNSYISYSCENYKIIFDRSLVHNDRVVEITPLTTTFLNLLLSLKDFNKDYYNKSNLHDSERKTVAKAIANIPYEFYKSDVSNVMDNPFYFPTERGLQSIFSLGKNSIGNLSDSLFNQLSKLSNISNSFASETPIEPIDVIYENRAGKGYIRNKRENEYYSLFNAASGYQAIIPIVLVMKYYNEKQKKKKTFLIEEPELNLFPYAQNNLIKYLIEQANKYNNGLVLTTHSPYTLTSLNNLMYAHQIGQTHPEKVCKKIDKKYWLNPADVSAYMLKSDGRYESIIDEEGLIKAEKIDEVSKMINKEFNAIMDIELGVDETTD